ncbi:4Fe-4S binding protein [Desulfurispora thermophila]|uniref:4Fe-4S binding protein n=1 Tax=Desulfurispora thermophila TaxID=265470 RepID=UPI000371BBBE|nr:4Fe-4S binding protein [Desulfurispora thermophila]
MSTNQNQRKWQKVTWLGLPLVLIGGWFYPLLGFALLGCMVGAVGIALFDGRSWCNWMCPRGSFFDLFMEKISAKRQIPRFFRRWPVRAFMVLLIFFMMGLQWYLSWGNLPGMGLALVRILTVTTIVGIILAVVYSPRTWCLICPMGTIANLLTKKDRALRIEPSCVNCKLCSKACPMQLKPYNFRQDGVLGDRDCIKCSSCVAACPKKALSFAGQAAENCRVA